MVAATVSTPVSEPRDGGVKTTPVVQLAPAARMAAHVFWERLNGPVTVRESPLAAVPPEFETVTVCKELGLFRSCAGNES